jgi:predicted CoA-substrate-specific enzyme activase
MKSLGLCIGSSSIGYIIVEKEGPSIRVIEEKNTAHEGSPESVIRGILTPERLVGLDFMAVTGRKFRNLLKTQSISEPEAVEIAHEFVASDDEKADAIVSAGGETMMVYQIDRDGRIIDVAAGNKCASGTGEFFLQQTKRMGLDARSAVAIADIGNPYKVSGRCSVFCKSDCTHALNKGVLKGNVVAGLSEMMAGKVVELVKRMQQKNRDREFKTVMFIGGTSLNDSMVQFIRKRVPGLVIPPHATVFEALGVSLWALKTGAAIPAPGSELFRQQARSFTFLPPLADSLSRVTFRQTQEDSAKSGDSLILGLDVGSTTTKAVLIRTDAKPEDTHILAKIYLRTNGDPIEASRQCYAELRKQIPGDVKVIGLGVTGSGRQIAGLHAFSRTIINEIIAHATAAVHYQSDVDTIFEIGGQDAKYTYLTNGVASDYAMNEACSAGTGSFLEEAAHESLNIDTEKIGDIAMKAQHPANFSDQCAAFINSDIKNAIQEGISIEDIAAGLINSICVNYFNRVKGNREAGEKIFMQGGVCYNRAVPVAMAAFTGKRIIVPPEPGLMGAFGVALAVRKKIELGLAAPQNFDLDELATREVSYKDPFVCAGGKEKCDRKCSVNRIVIKGKTYAFGGACNRYYKMLYDQAGEADVEDMDLVQKRERMVYETFSVERARQGGWLNTSPAARTIAINRSLLANTYYPLYFTFFSKLGYRVRTEDSLDQEGFDRLGAAFCNPVEISHAAIACLIKLNPDIYFLPKVKSIWLENRAHAGVCCPFVHAEASYLMAAFPEIAGKPVFSPVFDFAKGLETSHDAMIAIARALGHGSRAADAAFREALRAQRDFADECRRLGEEALARLHDNPNEIGIVLFGRPYNAFSKMANKGIPHKFASRNYRIIPCDFLPYPEENAPEHIYWGSGEIILKAAKFVHKHPQLFGSYITNFSCGPDSFLIGFFRKEMGRKPSLTLELDNHTADTGIDTRIEAYLDVIKTYIEINKHEEIIRPHSLRMARCHTKGNKFYVNDSDGHLIPFTNPRVHLLIPSMGDLGSHAAAAALRREGIRATAVPDPTEAVFRLGTGNCSGKECLPAMITLGSLLAYLKNRPEDTDEILVYFMPGDSGPCRFGSYYLQMQNVVERLRLRNIAFLNLSQEDGYKGFRLDTLMRIWQALLIADTCEEIYAAILVCAEDRDSALRAYRGFTEEILKSIEKDSWGKLLGLLKTGATKLAEIPRGSNFHSTAKVSLINEMYVRRNDFARQHIVERLAEKGIIVKVVAFAEWNYYLDYMVRRKLTQNASLVSRGRKLIEYLPKHHYEGQIKVALALSGLYEKHMLTPERNVEAVKDLVPETLICESIVIVGSTIAEIAEEVAGVISIIPFGCMPGRIGEAIITKRLHDKKRELRVDNKFVERIMDKYPHLPFLSLEVDGNSFPPGTEANLETFCLHVHRVNKRMNEVRDLEVGMPD